MALKANFNHRRLIAGLAERRRWVRCIGLAAVAAVYLWPGAAVAQSCTAEQAGEATDRIGASLRGIAADTQPKLDAKIAQLKAKRGWTDSDADEKAYAAIADKRAVALDTQANELLARIDSLGAFQPGAVVECGKIQEIETVGIELQATVRAKLAYALSRLDALLADDPAGSVAKSADLSIAVAPPAAKPPVAAAPAPSPPASQQPASIAVAPKTASPPPPTKWSTTTTAEAPPPPPLPTPPLPAPQSPAMTPDDGYTIDEIVLASNGFFGKVSAGLGSIIEHAFSNVGRPAGYILGNEGGGAFIAGLRYGGGTLYLRSGGSMPIHWHGPSLGTDFGASGSKVMFLVYRMQAPEQLFAPFSGIEGSAYLVGGVGFTLMTNGQVQMAPIRSGLGLRLGANVGYIRFTRKPTWNPF